MTLLGAPGLVLALLLAGCGAADTAAPSTTAQNHHQHGRPHHLTAGDRHNLTGALGRGHLVERERSLVRGGPRRMAGQDQTARLLKSLPKELGNEPRELAVDPRQEGGAGAFYGKVGSVWVATEEHQEGAEKLTAYQHLQAGFGGSSRRADLAWGRSA